MSQATGEQALQAGDWSAASTAFRAAAETDETGQALFGLGEALWWLGDLDGSIDARERAFSAFRRSGDHASATLAALFLSFDYRWHVGNTVAASGWVARAARLVETWDLTALRGWLRFFQACDCTDPAEAEGAAREALEFARDSGDLDLELCALSQVGGSMVAQGRVREGVRWLDEAMTGSLGDEGTQRTTVVFASCNMMVSCTRGAEFERAAQWISAADAFTERYGCPFLYAECRAFYGGVLTATGEWQRAEAELLAAVETSRSAVPAIHRLALAMLAELRLAQGRLTDAERLVEGMDDHGATTAVWARIHLLHGRPKVAAAALRRRLDLVGHVWLESAELTELLGEAELALGQTSAARQRGQALADLGEARACPVISARGHRLQGRALADRGDPEAARTHLDTALSTFLDLEMPFEAARTRAVLAEALRDHDPEVAVAAAQVALETFERLGAAADADATAALLRRSGVKAARAGPRDPGALTRREREVLDLLGEGLSNPEIARRLHLSRKTVEHHVAKVLAKLGVRRRSQAAIAAVRDDARTG